jgi:hypothetical protein
VTMRHDTVRRNVAALTASWPDSVGMLAIAGGVHVGGGVTTATVRDTAITDNRVSMTNSVGYTTAFSGGLHGDILLTLSGDDISRNSVFSATLPGSPSNAQGDSGAGEIAGSITRTRFNGNTVTVHSEAGDVSAGAGAMIYHGQMTDTEITANALNISSPHGTATVAAAGLLVEDTSTLKATQVTANIAHVSALHGTLQGGGIFDAPPIGDGPPGGPLTLISSTVARNVLSADSSVTVSGGGIFTRFPVTLRNTSITGNSPDECDGC